MRIIVIGAGFVGAPLCRSLAEAGHDVIPVTRGGGDRVVACDVADRDSVAALGAADVVVHCASSGRGGDRVARYRAVYFQGCENIIEALNPARLIFVSSSSVYGQTDGSIVDETAETEPSTETSRVLLAAESLVLNAGGTVARLAGIYGPGRSYLLKKFLEGSAQIDGESAEADGRWINQIHREDAASALAHLVGIDSGDGIYNVADSTPLLQRTCYQEFVGRFGGVVPPVRSADRGKARGWSDKRVSNAKLLAAGWQPRFASYFDALDGDPLLVPSIRAQL
jgi:nucleoside-diphosphate-sugar epimerase